MAKTTEERSEELWKLIRGAMKMQHLTAKKVHRMIESPMCVETLRLKINDPMSMKVYELRDVCQALGIPEGAWKGVI